MTIVGSRARSRGGDDATAHQNEDRQLRLRVLVVFGAAVAVVTMLGIPAHATYGARVTADEPQYLLSAISLGDDFDLDIADEIARHAERPFHAANLDPQTEPDDAGHEFSPHDPGLPVLLAVPMKLGGWVAAKAFLALCAGALAAVTAWLANRRFAVSPLWALATVGAFALTTPLSVYATQVYPELPAALVVVAAVAVLTGAMRTRSIVLVSVAIAALPWLSVKYAPVAASLAVLALLRVRSRHRAALALVVALAVQGLVYLVVHKAVYGGWTVYASGDHFSETGEFSVVGVDPNYVARTPRLIGLLVDRQFGLAAWMPGWLLLLPALGALARRRPAGSVALVVPSIVGWLVATYVALTMHGWWWPGRQVVVVAPLLVVVIAWWLPQVRWSAAALAVAALLGIGSWVWTEIEAITRHRTLVVDFMHTANPWYRVWQHALPDHRRSGGVDDVLTAIWVLIAAALFAYGWYSARRAAGDPIRRPTPSRRSAGPW